MRTGNLTPGSPTDQVGSTGTPACATRALAVSLSPIASIAAAGGPTQHSPAGLDSACETRAFRQEAVAWMDCVRAQRERGPHHGVGVEVGLLGSRTRQSHDPVELTNPQSSLFVLSAGAKGHDAERPTRPCDAACDLPPVGDEEAADHSRNTPKLSAPRIGAYLVADNAIASTQRVSRGSMMPSSTTRPVA